MPATSQKLAKSAGLLMYRVKKGELQVFLVHPGGPYYQMRDIGVWGIPKGQTNEGEDLLDCAKREFIEETSIVLPNKRYIYLGEVLAFSRMVSVWAFQKNHKSEEIKSNTFHMEWPPSTGQEQEFPEVDIGKYFSVKDACIRIHPSQFLILERLVKLLKRKK